MNAVTQTSRPQQLAANLPELPALSQSLANMIEASKSRRMPGRHADDPGLLCHGTPLNPKPEHKAEAQKVVAAYDVHNRTEHSVARQWMTALNASVGNPQSREAFEARFAAMVGLLVDYPASAFSADSLRDAQRQFKFFPASSELCELLDLHARPHQDTHSALRRIAEWKFPEPEEDREPPATPEQIAESKAKWAATKAELDAAKEARVGATAKPLHASDGHLLEAYRQIAAQGGHCAGAARTRIEMIERRIREQRA